MVKVRCRYGAISTILILFGLSHSINAWSVNKTLLNWFKNSDVVAELHAKHVASPEARHMMKDTPLVTASDESKREFASGPIGDMVSKAMAAEQELLGDWKVQKIVEAAAGDGRDFDEEASHAALLELVQNSKITLFSFVDCPWCLLAKDLLHKYYNGDDVTLQVIELEELGWRGKEVRAAIALSTGRTSMPACFVNGKSIGGFTDGFQRTLTDKEEESILNEDAFVPSSFRDLRHLGAGGLKAMHESGELQLLLLDKVQ